MCGSTTVFGAPLLETNGVTAYAPSSGFLCAATPWGASKKATNINEITRTKPLPTRTDPEDPLNLPSSLEGARPAVA
jgi:hypothetical protein